MNWRALNHTPSALPTPIARTPRVSLFRELETLLHALSLYGAAGITAFGWAVCHLLDWSATPWLALWFCAALLIYNADRLRPDPADLINIPHRAAASLRWRWLSRAVFAGAAVFLLAWPLFTRDWLTLGLVLGGAFVCLNYSIPLLGFRWKNVPLLKTFFAPTIVTAAILALPALHPGPAAGAGTLALTASSAWSFLLFNMILCDLRDVAGDRACGIHSLPVMLGEKGTRWLLAALLLLLEVLALVFAVHAPEQHRTTWRIAGILGPLHLGSLLIAVRRPRSERFHEWAVEGLLFLPALAIVMNQVLKTAW